MLKSIIDSLRGIIIIKTKKMMKLFKYQFKRSLAFLLITFKR